MKKVLFVLPLLGALVFAGCKGPNQQEQSKITSVVVKPEKATLAIGAEITLTPIVTPAEEKGEFTWSSSDTLIATVDQEGNVRALAAGTAFITATEKGGLSGKSEIKVTSYLESFKFGEAMVYDWSPKDTVGANIGTITSSDGETYNAYAVPINFMVFSEGFYVSEDGKYSGSEEALVIEMPCTFAWAAQNINPGKDAGYIFVLGPWQIKKDSSDYYFRAGEPGVYGAGVLENTLKAVDAYNQQNYTDYGAYMRSAGEAVSGTTMTNWSYNCNEDGTSCGYSSSYVADAILEEAYFYANGNGSSSYMVALPYCSFTFRELRNDYEDWWFGMPGTYDEENDQINLTDRSKLYISDPIVMEFGEKPSNASRNVYEKFPETILPSEEVMANLKRQVEESHARVLNFKHK